jgi:hypothetical protein
LKTWILGFSILKFIETTLSYEKKEEQKFFLTSVFVCVEMESKRASAVGKGRILRLCR